jgi:glycosyltransferase involved in cell wall biosynthesis
MKIVIINQPQDRIAPAEEQRGSVAIVNWELARQLARSHRVVIYAPRGPGQARVETWQGIEIRRIPRVAKRFHKAIQLLVGRLFPHAQYFNSRLYFREYYAQIIRQLREQPPDIVHLPQQLQFAPLLRRKLPTAKIVVHMHQDELASLDYAPLVERLRTLDAVVTVSDYVTGRARARLPQFANKIHTIGNGVDVGRFQPGNALHAGVVKLLFVGRISPDKGVHILVDAFNELVRKRSDVQLTIVGKPGMLPFDVLRLLLRDDVNLERLREFYGRSLSGWLRREVFGQRTSYMNTLRKRLSPQAEGKVRFLSLIPTQELIRTYQDADLLILPSIWHESYGLPIAEAMACGTAVLASRTGGIPELVEDGVTGVLVPPCSPSSLGKALADIVADRSALKRMGLAARDRAQTSLTWQRSAAHLESVYRSLIEEPEPFAQRADEVRLSEGTGTGGFLVSAKPTPRARL